MFLFLRFYIFSLFLFSAYYFQIFNILAIIFAHTAENPYFDVKNVIKFTSIAWAAAIFSFITLAVVVVSVELRDSLKWLRNELLIQCALIIVYVYGDVTMVSEILECYHTLDIGCPRQLTATVRTNNHIYKYFYGLFLLRSLFFPIYPTQCQCVQKLCINNENIRCGKDCHNGRKRDRKGTTKPSMLCDS